jgi:hypothetical protein
MEEENLLTPQDLQLLSPATPSLTPASTDSGFDAWLGERGTNVGDAGSMDTTQPQRSSAGPRPIRGQSNNANIKQTLLLKVWQELMVHSRRHY